jgi:hypothetical protein
MQRWPVHTLEALIVARLDHALVQRQRREMRNERCMKARKDVTRETGMITPGSICVRLDS